MSNVAEPDHPRPLQSPIDPLLLERINEYLHTLSAQEILRWGLENLPNLYQTTAFGLTGLVQLDMLSKLATNPPPLIFVDTLYHFEETLDLVEEVKRRYGREVHVYKPEGCETTADFEAKHVERLWERDETTYDFLVKARSSSFPFLSSASSSPPSLNRYLLQWNGMLMLPSRNVYNRSSPREERTRS